jgi:DNA-binding NtrC family response regulator
LYYRLNVLNVKVPQLRERLEDFAQLVELFAKNSRVGFTSEALTEMKKYSWPGQVRELKNFIARAGALYSGQFVELKHVNSMLELSQPHSEFITPKCRNALRDMEIQLISEKLLETKGNIRRCARELGLPKSTLYDRIRSYQISVEDIILGQRSKLTVDM